MISIENNLKEQKVLLDSLRKGKFIKEIIKKADKGLLKALCDIVYNILLGNCKLTHKEHSLLKNYKLHLRRLVIKSSLEKKIKILNKLIKIIPDLVKISQK